MTFYNTKFVLQLCKVVLISKVCWLDLKIFTQMGKTDLVIHFHFKTAANRNHNWQQLVLPELIFYNTWWWSETYKISVLSR